VTPLRPASGNSDRYSVAAALLHFMNAISIAKKLLLQSMGRDKVTEVISIRVFFRTLRFRRRHTNHHLSLPNGGS
jgi:hypothetical protein